MSVIVEADQQSIVIDNVLLDTGSGACVFRSDDLAKIGVIPHPDDNLRKMTGIGGDEYVFEKQITALKVGDLIARSFLIQLGAVDYGININGILGFDFLLTTNAKVDFQNMRLLS